ncbi:MAG: hypothetical protein AAF985_20315 [Bacteroidota bacterium]
MAKMDYKNRIKNHQSVYDPEAWAKMSQLLEEVPERKAPPFWKRFTWLFLLLFLFCFTLGGYWSLQHFNPELPPRASTKSITNEGPQPSESKTMYSNQMQDETSAVKSGLPPSPENTDKKRNPPNQKLDPNFGQSINEHSSLPSKYKAMTSQGKRRLSARIRRTSLPKWLPMMDRLMDQAVRILPVREQRSWSMNQ